MAHPLFQIFFETFGSPLGRTFGMENVAIAHNASWGAAGLGTLLYYLERLGVERNIAWWLTWVLGISTPHIIIGSLPETFIFPFASLVVMPLLYVAMASDRRSVVALSFATLLYVGITITSIVFSVLGLGGRAGATRENNSGMTHRSTLRASSTPKRLGVGRTEAKVSFLGGVGHGLSNGGGETTLGCAVGVDVTGHLRDGFHPRGSGMGCERPWLRDPHRRPLPCRYRGQRCHPNRRRHDHSVAHAPNQHLEGFVRRSE